MRSLVARSICLLKVLVDPTRDSAEDFSALRVIGVGEDDVVSRGFDVERVSSCRFLLGCLSSSLRRNGARTSSGSVDNVIERRDGV